ncbi:hypothetical protein [Azospirillum sp. B4]|uniref:hypothetical protein n=1 Tax=Azospirillum sp. B4 TaxID=95605 RepID=UPI00034C9872|nr:hypothetical protein [Azospirillum sp. B4]
MRIAVFAGGLLALAVLPGGAGAGQPTDARNGAPTIAVDPAACQWVVRHEPAPDVAYQPGVDVNGDPVAPADLAGGPRMRLPQRIEIPLTARLAGVLPRAPGVRPRADAYLGSFTVEGDQVLFDGQPLTDPAERELAILCRQQGVTAR